MTPETTTSQNVRHAEGAEQVAALVCDAVSSGTPIVDYGVAHGGLGHPPPANRFNLEQRGRIIEHYQRDLTVRVAGGATVAATQTELNNHNQFLPLDADDDLTIGEILTHNVYGPLRIGFGTIRSLLLGLRYIDGEGRDIHVGGRTVKNVAGYDVSRFLVGSLGELGIVYEATIRTYAVPEHSFCVELVVDDPAPIGARVTTLMLTDAAPAWIHLGLEGDSWRLRLGYYGGETALGVVQQTLDGRTGDLLGASIDRKARQNFCDDAALRSSLRRWRRTAPAVLKIVTTPSLTGQCCAELRSRTGQKNLKIEAFPAHGCIFVGGQLDGPIAKRLDGIAGEWLAIRAGFRIWITRPVGGESIDPFGSKPADFEMLCRLKSVMDPHAIFNPGRYLPAPETTP